MRLLAVRIVAVAAMLVAVVAGLEPLLLFVGLLLLEAAVVAAVVAALLPARDDEQRDRRRPVERQHPFARVPALESALCIGWGVAVGVPAVLAPTAAPAPPRGRPVPATPATAPPCATP